MVRRRQAGAERIAKKPETRKNNWLVQKTHSVLETLKAREIEGGSRWLTGLGVSLFRDAIRNILLEK